MKHLIFCAALLLPACFVGLSQSRVASTRIVKLHNLGNDSVNISYTGKYQLIEDSCATIVRYAHYDAARRKFYGPFRDVTTGSPKTIVAEGAYNTSGLKEGDFTIHYLNGRLLSKVSYSNDNLTGRGELYYFDGKPKLVFEAGNNGVSILEAWNADGKKTVEGGKGNYKMIQGIVCWTGKLTNGKPDGEWKAGLITDRVNSRVLLNEKFKDNKFLGGTNPAGAYTDSSHLLLIDENDFPFVKAEKMLVSSMGCSIGNGTEAPKRVVGAQYRDGPDEFGRRIADAVKPFLEKIDLSPFETELTIQGMISKNGMPVGWRDDGFSDRTITKEILNGLRNLPRLEPASVDGAPVEQQIAIIFKLSKGLYTTQYRLLPIKTD